MDNDLPSDASFEQSDAEKKPHHDEVITVVLTADNHLGFAGIGLHPRKREERQQRLRQALQQATDFAIMQGVDFFIQAGDLFDTPTPDERDRSFVAARLAQLKQAGVRAIALGGVYDTPGEIQTPHGEEVLAPQLSYARLGALHYFPPSQKAGEQELEPLIVQVRGQRVGICGVGVVGGQNGDPLARLRVQSDIDRATLSLLILHAPIEGYTTHSSLLNTRAMVSQASIQQQTIFQTILAGYHHQYSRTSIGQTELVIAGAAQHIDFSAPEHQPGFVFLGLAEDGIRWCNHIKVDAYDLKRLVIHTDELWSSTGEQAPTNRIIEQLQPLCSENTMIQLRLAGELTRSAYHQLDLNRIRRYGEEHCFALAIDDSALTLSPDEAASSAVGERFSPREELIALADEWIAAAQNEQEQKALHITKEELLLAMDEIKSKR